MTTRTTQTTAGLELDRPRFTDNRELVRWIAARAGVEPGVVERARRLSRTHRATSDPAELAQTRRRVSAALDRPSRTGRRPVPTARTRTTSPADARAARYEEQLSR